MSSSYVPLASLRMSFAHDGDEWISWLGSELSEEDGVNYSGNKFDATTKPFYAIKIASWSGQSRSDYEFFVAPLEEYSLLLVDSEAEIPSEIVELVTRAAVRAAERLGEEGPEHHWSAIVGADTSQPNAPVHLEGSGQVGALQIRSSNRILVEGHPPQQPTFMSYHISASIPIEVTGAHRGHAWDAASIKAARDLHCLCALLSVAWASCVVVREAAAPLDWGRRTAPHKITWQNIDSEPSEAPPPHIGKTLPEWLSSAWENAQSKPRIRHPLAVHYEALRAQDKHPSLSFVGFIASIEAISQLIFHEQRCTECRSHRNVAAKFRKTLEFVLDKDEAEELGQAYTPRSKIVHAGHLYGSEDLVGRAGPPPLLSGTETDAFMFRWQLMYRMRFASEALLLLALKDELPAKRHFEPTE